MSYDVIRALFGASWRRSEGSRIGHPDNDVIPNWDNPKLGLLEESFKFSTTPFMPGSLGTPRYRKLIAALIGARKNAQMTQAELASRLEKPQSFVAKYEREERRLDVIELVDISTALGIKTNKILAAIDSE